MSEVTLNKKEEFMADDISACLEKISEYDDIIFVGDGSIIHRETIENNLNNRNIEFSPIYDCGSCLNPMYDDSDIQKTKDTEIKNIAINSYSCIKENGKKINYMTYIKQMKNEECNKAVKRVYSKIDINEINKFIDNIECMSVIRKKFYKQILEIRYNIIKDVYEKIVI